MNTRKRTVSASRLALGATTLVAMLGVLTFTVGVAAAATGTSASEQYDKQKVIKLKTASKPVVKGVSATATSTGTPTAATTGTLPFTGVSLVGVVVVGFGLVGLGFMLIRGKRGEQS